MNRLLRSTVPAIVLALWSFATPIPADENRPASAIPWLSRSFDADGLSELHGRDHGSTIETITVEKLPPTDSLPVGLLKPATTGFPDDLWRGVTPNKARQILANTRYGGVPANRSLFRQILLSESDNPVNELEPQDFLLLRVDRLLEIGALPEAQALIEIVGPNSTALFRRWFDIGLLTNQADEVCSDLDNFPGLSPARQVKIFCLAIQQEWEAAATSLSLGEELGELTAQQADLLAFFLDESLLEEMDPPPIGTPLSSLEFVIRDSVGLPRPTSGLPTAFLHAELAEFVPLRFRIEAAETLVQQGVIPFSVLFAAYREEVPAASGGVWERQSAVQQMDAAETADEISKAFIKLDAEFSEVDLRMAAAKDLLLYLGELPPEKFDTKLRNLATVYLLLANAPEVAAAWLPDKPPAPLQTAYSIASGEFTGTNEIELVLSTETPADYLTDYQANAVGEKRFGEAVLMAVDLISKGRDLDQDDLFRALALLRSVGLEEIARTIAVQTLLLPMELIDAD